MQLHTVAQLSSNQELTAEGFLLCKNVAIARTGSQLYLAAEIPEITPDSSGFVRVERPADVVFAEQTLASFLAKSVTLDHPSAGVKPSNYRELTRGVTINLRQGAAIDAEDNFLLADLLVTDAEAIAAVRDQNIREVSCGYDAEYTQIEAGRAVLTSIVGNHVALVEKGRCGERCAIKDKEPEMKKPSWLDRARAAFKARDEDEFEKLAKEKETKDAESEETEEEKKKREADEEKKKTADSLAALADRVKKLEDKKAKDDEGDDEEESAADKKTNDAALNAQAADVAARAEILSPGVKLPTVDAKVSLTDALCALKRAALLGASTNEKTRDAVAPLLAGQNIAKLSCDALHATFVGASEIVRLKNNSTARPAITDAAAKFSGSIADMNKKAKEFWKQ